MADITKCAEDDPHRCQCVIASKGQCQNLAVEGGTMCLAHGGNKQLESIEKSSLKNYKLGRFRERLERHSGSANIKNLCDEIGILRMSLEIRLEQCTSEMDLILQSGPISDMVMKIERVVTSCHKLEGSMGTLLDKQAILQFANNVIGIIVDECSDEEIVGKIGDRILTLVGEQGEEIE